MSIKNSAAVVGVGSTPYYRRGGSWPQTTTEMACKAVLAALDEARFVSGQILAVDQATLTRL
jgi:hypothetical protein